MENSFDNKVNNVRDGVTQIGKDLRGDAHAAIDKAADKVPAATDRLAASAHTGVDKVADTATKIGDSVDSASATLAARGKQLSTAYKEFAESSRDHVRASPVISVLVAAAAGYGLSKLLGARGK